MIRLEKITWENYSSCIGIKLSEHQKAFMADNALSLIHAYVSLANDEYPWLPYALYFDDTVIGFAMIIYEPEDAERDYSNKDSFYIICRFMIAEEHQGKGYGKAALLQLIELIKTFPCGVAKVIELSYNHENTAARNLFLSVGFAETGENDDDGCAIAKLVL